MPNNILVFYPESLAAWRNWLEEHHASAQSVWVVFHTKQSGKKTITWSEAVDVALCFGWFRVLFHYKAPGSTKSIVTTNQIRV